MKLLKVQNIINLAFKFVTYTSKKYNIDESHALKHSMEVFHFAKNIYNEEVKNKLYLKNQFDIIALSSITHDMCDRKYINQDIGLKYINTTFTPYLELDKMQTVNNIISSMSYSKVKKDGYPNLGNYQHTYHIVREADLLSAYDIDRCIIFAMIVEKMNYTDAVNRAIELFNNRVLKYREDSLFVTNYSKNKSLQLHNKALNDIKILMNK